MSDWWPVIWPWLAYASLLAASVVGLLLNILGLPGLWLIVIAAVAYAWLFGFALIGIGTLAALLCLGIAAEVVEFVAGAAGARSAGGSKRGMAGAIVGGLVGGLVGTPIVPVLGTIVGAILGTFVGNYVVELGVGRSHGDSARISYGAAKGRFWGMIYKSLFGIAMTIVVAIAALPLASRRLIAPPIVPTSQPAAPIVAANQPEAPTSSLSREAGLATGL